MKTCLKCGDSFRGRSDKKFCSDSCRSGHFYDAHSKNNEIIRNINSYLKKNYEILNALNTGTQSVISKQKLIIKGFNFKYYTQTKHNRNGLTYYFLYDQGYACLPNGAFTLIRKKSRLDNLP